MPKAIYINNFEDLKSHCVVNENGCWIWQHSYRGPMKYAQVNGRSVGVKGQMGGHVFSFMLRHGYRPKLAMHSCGTPLCCNPDHISEGTHQQNHQDSWSRGRREHQREVNRIRMKEDREGIYAKGRELAHGTVYKEFKESK